ncbi:Protein BIG GRAIN 1-like E [Cardamine amara subsp. amara]|uniref:Protein BIG GRAIN 1-like E n=1 Tax=Cardamine amara subsp. amara TaxID=228776 RepID=A0ABD1BMT6_CARAN
MSIKGISSAEPDKLSKRISPHKRNSEELDVFEAAVYFSGYNEASSGDHRHTQKYGYNVAREDNRKRWGILGGGRRISLDLPIRCSEQVHHLHQDHHEKDEVTTIKDRLGNVRHKQPSSPGGKIASFLNSLFHQAGSKKNKSKLKSKSKPNDPEVEEEIPGGGWMRRRRRSSMSHLLSSSRSNSTTTTTTSSSSKSLISSSSSGFRTPPPYLNTPTKNYKQFLNYTSATKQVGEEEKKTNNKEEFSWLDERVKVMESLSENQRVWADDNDDDRKIKREEDDDGMESDSSSDLFELQNYELSRGGLPVYETTNVAYINNTHI